MHQKEEGGVEMHKILGRAEGTMRNALRSVTIVCFHDGAWCFSTEHSDLGIAGAFPMTLHLGSEDMPEAVSKARVWGRRGPLVFNPVKRLEPEWSVFFVEEMTTWEPAMVSYSDLLEKMR